MNIKSKGKGIRETEALRYGENTLSPVPYTISFPEKVLMRRIKGLIKNTKMTSENERFAIPAVDAAVETALRDLAIQRADHLAVISKVARDDGLKKKELEEKKKTIDSIIRKVHVKWEDKSDDKNEQ